MPLYNSTESRTVSSIFLRSNTITHLINPHLFTQNAIFDSRTILIKNPNISKLSDEEILARYIHGYFNGWAFFPEKLFFSIMKRLFGWTLKAEFPGRCQIHLYASHPALALLPTELMWILQHRGTTRIRIISVPFRAQK